MATGVVSSTIMVRSEVKDTLAQVKKATGMSMASIVTAAVDNYIDSDEFRSVVKLAQLRVKHKENMRSFLGINPKDGGGDDSL